MTDNGGAAHRECSCTGGEHMAGPCLSNAALRDRRGLGFAARIAALAAGDIVAVGVELRVTLLGRPTAALGLGYTTSCRTILCTRYGAGERASVGRLPPTSILEGEGAAALWLGARDLEKLRS